VRSVTTTKSAYTLPDGTKKQSDTKNEVRAIQLEESPLDPALFEIPAGFKLVQHIERNPAMSGSSSTIEAYWQRLKASVTNFFSR
jgi:hypothetical protein